MSTPTSVSADHHDPMIYLPAPSTRAPKFVRRQHALQQAREAEASAFRADRLNRHGALPAPTSKGGRWVEITDQLNTSNDPRSGLLEATPLPSDDVRHKLCRVRQADRSLSERLVSYLDWQADRAWQWLKMHRSDLAILVSLREQGYSLRDIAAEVGLSKTTTARRLTQADALLRSYDATRPPLPLAVQRIA